MFDTIQPKFRLRMSVSDQQVKRTNEIKTAIPLLDAIDIEGKEIAPSEIGSEVDEGHPLKKRS